MFQDNFIKNSSSDNIIYDRNADVLDAINGYKFPSIQGKVIIKINTNKLDNNKYLVYKIKNEVTKKFEVFKEELDNILDMASTNKSIQIEFITESLNSNNNFNNNYFEINNTNDFLFQDNSNLNNSKDCFT